MSDTNPASPIEPADPVTPLEQAASPRPDWLMGSDEGASRATDDASPRRPTVPGRTPQSPRDPKETAPLSLVSPDSEPASPAPESDAAVQAPGPVAWKAAASSVPRLREQPAASEVLTDDAESFPGFAQDGVTPKPAGLPRPESTDQTLDEPLPGDITPLDRDPGFLGVWLDRARFIRHPIALVVGAVLVIGAVGARFVIKHEPSGVSLAQIRQQPEAFEGRPVFVAGKAGESFSIGGSYVFNLVQGRDTIVVYSRSRRPGLHEDVKVKGSVSVGYLDGLPRVAVFEDTGTP